MYFQNYGLQKRLLDQCLKNLLAGDASTSNMVNGPNCWCNLDEGTFTIFIDHCEHNSVEKTLF